MAQHKVEVGQHAHGIFLRGSMELIVHIVAYVAQRMFENLSQGSKVPLLTMTQIGMCNNDTMTKK